MENNSLIDGPKMMADFPVIAIVGIDTDIGKTIATGLLGRYLLEQGKRIITQKPVQTGGIGLAADILVHRRLMGQDLQPEDHQGLTCSYVFAKPCSPHLAASLAGQKIDPAVIRQATRILSSRYEVVLLEGAGGLHVPYTDDFTFLDYLEQEGLPLIVVSSPRLGSINHTLSTLELAHARGLTVLGIIYNHYLDNDPLIAEDSARLFAIYLQRFGYRDCVIDLLGLDQYGSQTRTPDFSPLFM